MMKVYEVKVAKVDAYEGRFNGYEHIAYTLDENKAEEIKVKAIADIKAKNEWWMTTAKAKGEPDVVVVELGEVVA